MNWPAELLRILAEGVDRGDKAANRGLRSLLAYVAHNSTDAQLVEIAEATASALSEEHYDLEEDEEDEVMDEEDELSDLFDELSGKGGED